MAYTKLPKLVFAMVVMALAVISCQSNSVDRPTAEAVDKPISAEFLATKGTEWVYLYKKYEPIESQPTEIITATYLLTETVVEVAFAEPYQIIHVGQAVRSVNEPVGWDTRSSLQPKEYWYIVGNDKIYQSFQKVDLNDLQLDNLLLAYDLPLRVGKSWCPGAEAIGEQKLTGCTTAGERTVVRAGSQEGSFGRFEGCYQITSAWNSGGTVAWYCEWVGLVAQKYDHSGTRFGFEQNLIGYESGVP